MKEERPIKTELTITYTTQSVGKGLQFHHCIREVWRHGVCSDHMLNIHIKEIKFLLDEMIKY